MTDAFYQLNKLFEFWINTELYIALVFSIVVNFCVLLFAGYTIQLNTYILLKNNLASYINTNPLKKHQKRIEIQNGLMACIIFACCSMWSREQTINTWVSDLSELFFQLIVFTCFYEIYSFFIHKLLHHQIFIKFHGVHHRSVRVTPWTAYSVHPVEALFIGLSIPLFMLFFDVALGVAFIFHLSGTVFTMILHSNVILNKYGIIGRTLSYYSKSHETHHKNAKVNFGFISPLLDNFFEKR